MEVESSSLFLVAIAIFIAYQLLTQWLEKTRNTLVIKGILTLSLYITLLFVWFQHPQDHGTWNTAFVAVLSAGFLYSVLAIYRKWRAMHKPTNIV